MKNIFCKIVRLRNPNFSLDEQVSSRILLEFIWIQVTGMLRAARMIFWLRNPQFAILGKGVRLRYFSRIQFGRFMKLGDLVQMSALGIHGIKIGNNVSIGSFSQLIVSTSMNNIGRYIQIGNNVGIGEFAYLGGGGGLEIGDDCIIGQYFSCHPENHEFKDIQTPIRHQGVTRQGIRIGKNCWIGSKVTILDGVSIGDGCVVAAGSVVTKNFASGLVIAGVPAKIIKSTHASNPENTH